MIAPLIVCAGCGLAREEHETLRGRACVLESEVAALGLSVGRELERSLVGRLTWRACGWWARLERRRR